MAEQFGWQEQSRTNAWKVRRLEQNYTVKYFPKEGMNKRSAFLRKAGYGES